MAISSAQNHFRSISLPSRLNPYATKLEVELQKLKTREISKKSDCITTEGIKSWLLGLAELYNYVEELMLSPTTQKSLVQHYQNGKIVEESLKNSVELLDSCGAIRELVVMVKEQVQFLQSALRRKGQDSSIQKDMNEYFSFRKKMNKSIAKSLKKLKHLERKNGATLTDNHNLPMATRMLRKTTDYAISIFRSLLVFFSSPAASMGRWSLVSKVKSVASHRNDGILSEVGSVDFALNSLNAAIRNSNSKVVDVKMAGEKLQNLDASIEGLEAELERLFRQLLQSRVTILNILNY
ncbi:uncharacterized protein LOC111397743 [Olea europaea var. sylvestris]|uniref:DUF241 domain protein n=1 Tax=Olea europaea subsp. europaea TaxID=158383 RepID=A0A8S0QEN2_OLEEU|nr:uncharacterized protein LOC111397743 [Olea europaea var. sylvestris]CAA2965720.1 Hypothetical predicted protein [Olea europaea subsp. europaea]